jgi:hypothetical protein
MSCDTIECAASPRGTNAFALKRGRRRFASLLASCTRERPNPKSPTFNTASNPKLLESFQNGYKKERSISFTTVFVGLGTYSDPMLGTIIDKILRSSNTVIAPESMINFNATSKQRGEGEVYTRAGTANEGDCLADRKKKNYILNPILASYSYIVAPARKYLPRCVSGTILHILVEITRLGSLAFRKNIGPADGFSETSPCPGAAATTG